MNLAYLQTLVDYHYWARDIVLDAVNDLPREKFLQPVESSFKSLRDTVAHLYAADLVWYTRWMGEAPAGLIAYDQFPDATSIRTAWKELEGNVRRLVDGLGEEGVHKSFDYKLLSGAPDTAPFWQMLVHVVNHGSYHRGQVTTLMRQLGAHPPKPTDMIAFFRTRR
jgi:uncharacterized damage-inducible protein DinB